jgi:hypothetical protein
MVVVQESSWFWRTMRKSLLIDVSCSGVMMVLCALHHHDAVCFVYTLSIHCNCVNTVRTLNKVYLLTH